MTCALSVENILSLAETRVPHHSLLAVSVDFFAIWNHVLVVSRTRFRLLLTKNRWLIEMLLELVNMLL